MEWESLGWIKKKEISDRGNRTPGCRVRDGDVSHYTISDIVEKNARLSFIWFSATSVRARAWLYIAQVPFLAYLLPTRY
ncbi:hypothetical protein VN97_g2905 [Penicillium thymicola]|uniref:Uncharacterized protein n=1 Tax=Penicillium thymicola TaxID=293382 RepID=A0AAI9TNZ3_PENTH|nr:hypothetical protein VN97_g2905 [Penicillium thymicola]